MRLRSLRFVACLLLVAISYSAAADDSVPTTIIPTDYVVLPAVGQYGRLPVHRDAVEAQIVAGTWKSPEAGDTIDTLDGGQEIWQAVTASDGTIDARNHRGGYAFTTFDAPDDGVMLLEASGHAAVYVNGELHTGDPYSLGWLRLPVRVVKGRNNLLFHLAAEKLAARLISPPAKLFFADEDRTLPTMVRGEKAQLWAAVPIVNTTTEWIDGVELECRHDEETVQRSAVAPIAPLSVRKLAFQVPAAEADGDQARFEIRLAPLRTEASDASTESGRTLAESEFDLKLVDANDINVRTFRSRIDGSVQPYAIRPAENSSNLELDTPGVILTLHDAGANCEEHIARYTPKSWAHMIAPQGRRPYGFDWEAWGRIDVLEALADASKHYPCDPLRTCLTGYGMGGHGVWHLGVTFPDKFAAIGPSAGWISFWSYGGGMASFDNRPTEIEAMMLRGYSPSDTLKLLTNLATTGVYLLHDSADVDVPVEQARFLRERLASFHANFVYLEPTTADVASTSPTGDWPRMMTYFEHAERLASAEQTVVDFTTANPGVCAQCDWVTIDAQEQQLLPSRAVIRQDRDNASFNGTTTNVARLAIDIHQLPAGRPMDVTLDNQPFNRLRRLANEGMLWFERHDEKWSVAEPPSPKLKSSARNGTFNATVDHDAILVFGTKGNEEENRWAEAKARFDAETFYYRGNGALDVLPDAKFVAKEFIDRNVILYGNADTNSAWSELLPDCPIEIGRGAIRAGDRSETGDDLAVMMVRPRPDSDVALVGVVGGTGPAGMRLTNRLRWFVSGITYPDLVILGPKTLTAGTSDIRAWGFFGPDWKTDNAEIAWRAEVP